MTAKTKALTVKKVACLLVCLLLSACTNAPGTVYGDSDARNEMTACEQRGGVPQVFSNGHGGRTVVCFAKEVLR